MLVGTHDLAGGVLITDLLRPLRKLIDALSESQAAGAPPECIDQRAEDVIDLASSYHIPVEFADEILEEVGLTIGEGR